MAEKVCLNRIGCFYQLPEADRLHVLKLLASCEPLQDEEGITGYLDSGLLIAHCPGVETDPLLPDAPFAGPLHVLTDGQYAWPKTLSYWVRQHHLRLPDEFLEHIRSAGYRVPAALDPARFVLV
jgi:hypothetical protein